MKRYKFELGGSYVFYFGTTLGEAIADFMTHRPERVNEITSITEEPVKDYEKP